jgi:hypothetical protein
MPPGAKLMTLIDFRPGSPVIDWPITAVAAGAGWEMRNAVHVPSIRLVKVFMAGLQVAAYLPESFASANTEAR